MRVKLGDIFEIGSGGTPSKSHPEYYGGNIPWVKTGDLKNEYLYEVEDFITEEGLNNSSAKMYEEDTVLIAMYGATIGATSILKMKACTNQACAAFRKNEQVIPEYLYYFLRSQKEKFVKDGVGGAQPNISAGYLKKVKMELPSLDEQKVIVDILDKISDIVCKRSFELQSLDDLIKARFVEMFGNKGENPNGYEEDTLGNLYKFQYGKGNNIPEDKGEYPCYGSNGIVGHHTEYNNEDSPIIGHIGAYAGIVNWGAGKHYVTYNGVMCKLKTDRVNPTYGFHLLQQQDFNRVATKGGGQPFVSYGDLEAPIVVVPPIEVQEAYATFADKVDKSKFIDIINLLKILLFFKRGMYYGN